MDDGWCALFYWWISQISRSNNMRHICNAVRSVCKAQAHTSFHDWPWAGIWDLSCSSLFFGLRAADGGAGDWGSFGSWRNSQTRIIIRLLLSHSRQTTDLQWAIIWAIIEQECHADSGNLGVRNGWLTDLHPFVRGLIKQASTFHVHRFHGAPSQLFTGKHASSLLDFSFLSSSLDQHPSSSCRALDQRTHYLDGPPVSLHLYCVLR